jgi:hypothetical protein
MCRKVKCNKCSRPTWTGCGLHVQSALSGVAIENRCPGWEGGYGNCPGVPLASSEAKGIAQPVESAETQGASKATAKGACTTQ